MTTNLGFFAIVAGVLVSSCGILTQGSQLEVLQPDGQIQTINMAPRHYRVKDHCVDVVRKATPNLLASVAPLSTEQLHRLAWPKRISAYRAEDCASFHKRGRMMRDYDQIYGDRNDKIGVILPPVAANESALQLILDELKASLKRNGVDPEQTLVIRRVEKREDRALQTIAEFIHMERVSLLIGVNSIHSQAMAKLADPAQVPVFLVNPSTPHSKTRQTMRVYPPVQQLAQKLLDVYANAGVTHTTVLYPKGADLDLFDQLKRLGGDRIYFMEASYDPNSSQSLLSTINGATRRMTMIRSKAQAVLILDNFKMVRHLVNMIRGVAGDANLILTGNQQWRSPALVTPKEDALQGAMFVDFIGSYADLPKGLEVPMPESPFFTTAQAASRIDYQLIGHRLGTLSAKAIRSTWNRQRIAAELQSLNNSWDNYFPMGKPAFDNLRDSSWPSFLFRIEGETIQLVSGNP